METLFWVSAGLIFYTYVGYPLILKIITTLKCKVGKCCKLENVENNYIPTVSIIIAAYNEEKNIEKRIRNILEQDYPTDKIEIIVASDGSTDNTVEIAKKYEKYNVKVLDFKENRGRAIVHNDAVNTAKGEILVFTDAETTFEKNFIREIIRPFSFYKIGCVVGNLIYITTGSSISKSEGAYIKYEKYIRNLESDLCLLFTGTGACMAVRSNLWKSLSSIDDCDFSTPLDVILQGYKVIFQKNSIAYDYPPESKKREFKVRIRQVSKNFLGTIKKWGLSNYIYHPIYSLSIISHKFFRWFSFYFFLMLLFSSLNIYTHNFFYFSVFILQITFYTLGIVGILIPINNRIIALLSNFLIVNIGMSIGILKGIFGKAPSFYRS